MNITWCSIWAKLTKKKALAIFLALFISLPPFTFQILPSFSSDVKNKKVSYKEIRKRKHSKNKPNLKNQTAPSCQTSVVTKTETLSSGRLLASIVWNPVNNKAYIFAGRETSGTNLNQIVEYDPATSMLTTKSETLPSARYTTAAVWNPVNNKAYIFGGFDSSYVNQIIEYDPALGTVITKSETLPTGRYNLSAVWNPINNKAYIFGGIDSSGNTNQIIEYNPATGAVVTKAETLPTARRGTSAVWNPVNNKAYIFGGFDSGYVNQIIEYDPALGTVVTKTETLPTGRFHPFSAWSLVTNKAYIFGGTDPAGRLSQIIEYDPAAGTVVTKTETLPFPRDATSVILNPTNNKIIVLGGRNSASSALDQILEYTPCSGPSNPIISSATLNGAPQTVSSSYRVASGQTLVVNVSSTDGYSGNQVRLSCNPPAGIFSSSPAYIGTGRLEFTPTPADVGNTYNYTVTATSNSGAQAASTLSFSVSVSCSSDGPSGICVRGAYCTPCKFVTGICASDPLCVFTQPQIAAPPQSSTNPVQTPSATPTPTPVATATPVQNITNNGSSASSQGTTVSPPQINTTAPSINTNISKPLPSTHIDPSLGGEVPNNPIKQPSQPTPKPFPTPPSIDFSLLKNNPPVKTDSASSYIDLSKDGLVKPGK